MGKDRRLASSHALQPPGRLSMAPEPILCSGPANQGEVETVEDRSEFRFAVTPVVPDPAPQGWIEHVRQVAQGFVRAPGDPPSPQLLAHLPCCPSAHGRAERHEQSALPVAHQAWPESEAQEIEGDVGIAVSALRILAVHELRFLRMDFQLAPSESFLYRLRTCSACSLVRQCTRISSAYLSNCTRGNVFCVQVSNARWRKIFASSVSFLTTMTQPGSGFLTSMTQGDRGFLTTLTHPRWAQS